MNLWLTSGNSTLNVPSDISTKEAGKSLNDEDWSSPFSMYDIVNVSVKSFVLTTVGSGSGSGSGVATASPLKVMCSNSVMFTPI